MLFLDTLPQNGDLIHANYGTTNDFWIQRVGSSWDQTLGYNNQPTTDTTGQVHVPQTSQPFLNLNLDVTTMVNNMLANGNYGFTMRLIPNRSIIPGSSAPRHIPTRRGIPT